MIDVDVVDIVPWDHSDETNQDSEPNLAVNWSKPNQIVATAFTPPDPGTTFGPLYVTEDGGATWGLSFVVPMGADISDFTPKFGRTSHSLYVAALYPRGMFVWRTTDLNQPSSTQKIFESPDFADQPFIQATTVLGADFLCVGCNDQTHGLESATLLVCRDANAGSPSFEPIYIDVRPKANSAWDGPQVRPVIHEDGTIYAVFFRVTSVVQHPGYFTATGDIVVVRDDDWAASPNAFKALSDPGDGLPGNRVATVTASSGTIGQQNIDPSSLSIAVDPRTSSTVYLSWCDNQPSGFTLHVRRSQNRGVDWSRGDILTAPNVTNQGLTINSLGTVGLMYQHLNPTSTPNRWETHFRRSFDGLSWDDYILSTTPADTPVAAGDPYLGDYAYVLALDKDFMGVFCANNTPDPANFPLGVRFLRRHDFAAKQLYGLADPCQELQDEVDSFAEALRSGEIPAPPRTPERIAAARRHLTELEAELRRCRKHPNLIPVPTSIDPFFFRVREA